MRIFAIIVIGWLVAISFGEMERHQIEHPTIMTLDLEGYARPIQVTPSTQHLMMGGDTRKGLRLVFHGAGRTLSIELSLKVKGMQPQIVGFDQRTQLPHHCEPTPDQNQLCVFRVQLAPSDQAINIISPGVTSISGISIKLINSTRSSALGNIPIITIFAFLVIIGPVFWHLKFYSSQYAIVIVGTLWIFSTDARIGVLIICMLLSFYFAMRHIIVRSGSIHVFKVAVFYAIGLFILLKGVVPIAGVLFVNPGELMMLPLGFSYFIIRIVDLLFKAHARQIRTLGPMEYFAYMLFPPALAAGPVMTLPQFNAGFGNFSNIEDRSIGLMRAFAGLAKKLMADTLMLRVLAPALAEDYAGGGVAVLAVQIGFVLYVYLDFSGYSDIAIGTARWWGWRIPENFNAPLIRSSMRAFWQNWHMSMTQWVSRHVFLQAGMELRRASKWAQIYLPTLATMSIIALWHGLSLVWIFWAIHHAMGIFLGDLALRLWPIGGKQTAGALATPVAMPWRASRYIVGVAFVWYWVALGHSFALSSNPEIALTNYVTAATFGLL